MASNTTTQFQFVLVAARAAVESLNLKGSRSTAALDFIRAESADDRQDVVDEHGAGMVRRGLRQLARAQKDEEVAGAFWLLRDMIDADGEVDTEDEWDGTDAVDAAA